MRVMARVWEERWRPRPPVVRRRRKESVVRGLWREGIRREILTVWGRSGRRDKARSGARAMKAKIWWGEEKDLLWCLVSMYHWYEKRDGMGWDGMRKLTLLYSPLVAIPNPYETTRKTRMKTDTPTCTPILFKNPASRTFSGHRTNSAKQPTTACARFFLSRSFVIPPSTCTPLAVALGSGIELLPVAASMSMVKWPYLTWRFSGAERSSLWSLLPGPKA
jgi:hypothetical protein